MINKLTIILGSRVLAAVVALFQMLVVVLNGHRILIRYTSIEDSTVLMEKVRLSSAPFALGSINISIALAFVLLTPALKSYYQQRFFSFIRFN